MARKRYNKGKRVDMRQGGRVALAKGKQPKNVKVGPFNMNRQKLTDFVGQDAIKKDPAPAPEKVRPQTASISQPQPQASPQPQVSPVTGEEMDFEVPAIGANEDTAQVYTGDPKTATGKGGREGGPWWRRAGFNSKEEAIAAGWKNIGGVWTPPNTTNDDTPPDDTPPDDTPPDDTPPDDDQGNVTYDPDKVREAIDWAASADPAYAKRVAEEQEKTRGIVQEAAEGKVPETAVIPDAVKADENIAATTKQMSELTEAEAAEAAPPAVSV